MTIDEAIQKQNEYLKNSCPVLPAKVKEAMELGIEALKYIKAQREGYCPPYPNMLFGEIEK